MRIAQKNPRNFDRIAEIESLLPGTPPAREVLTPISANRLTQLFRTLYLHGEPFDAEKLLGAWARCRDEAITLDTCEQELERAREESPLEDEEVLKRRLTACGDKQVIGPLCQQGLSEAQRVLAP